jgi:hypothetical protein
MSENSVGATVFATWQFNFYNSLFKDQIKDASVRLSIVANYPFIDYFQRMLHTLIEDPDNAGPIFEHEFIEQLKNSLIELKKENKNVNEILGLQDGDTLLSYERFENKCAKRIEFSKSNP